MDTLRYVCIDRIKQALQLSDEMCRFGVEGSGYLVGNVIAGDLLEGDNDVLAECVNPMEITTMAWHKVA
jgi:hypothetical protein